MKLELPSKGKRLLIVGTGGQGKVVLDCAISVGGYDEITFMTNDLNCKEISDFPIIYEPEMSISCILNSFNEVVVAIGDNEARLNKSRYYSLNGIRQSTLIHPRAVVSRFAQIGEGTVILANAVVNPFSKIGEACIINTGAIVEHDCTLSDGVHISPNATMGGAVSIGEKTWLCIGSSIKNNIIIGSNSIIGAGSVVLSDIPDNVVASGVPAIIKKRI